MQDASLASRDNAGLAIGKPVIIQLAQNIFASDVFSSQLGWVFNHSDHNGFLKMSVISVMSFFAATQKSECFLTT
jgi:hypothetical protein